MEPFLGQITAFGFNFAPRGWAQCNGQLLSISQNTALFSLLGTTYGGDGRTTFALPDLRGRAPMHFGQGPGLSNRTEGETGGTEAVTLNVTQIPAHNHGVSVKNAPGDQSNPGGNFPAGSKLENRTDPVDTSYSGAADGSSMNANVIQQTGGSQPHNNMQPYLVLNYCIAVEGIYPSRS